MTDPQGLPAALRALDDVWQVVRQRLDRHGSAWRGTVACPPLRADGRLALQSLLGGGPPRRLDLAKLEAALVARGIGADLDGALTALGHPPSRAAAERRAAKALTDASRRGVDAAIADWAEEWAPAWSAEARRGGLFASLDTERSVELVDDVRRFLDRTPDPLSRTDLAASLYGDSHALDVGTRRRTAIVYALRHLHGALEEGELWEAAGVSSDHVSAPALVWNLQAVGDSPVTRMLDAARMGDIPIHLSLFALRRFPIMVASDTIVHVVENPRLVEGASERRLDATVIAANGNPSRAVTTLLRQLLDADATVRYHGDFDSAGLAITARMQSTGAEPWLMTADRYRTAIDFARSAGLDLPTDPRPAGPTPWDPDLAVAFNDSRRIVHEELIIDDVLAAMR